MFVGDPVEDRADHRRLVHVGGKGIHGAGQGLRLAAVLLVALVEHLLQGGMGQEQPLIKALGQGQAMGLQGGNGSLDQGTGLFGQHGITPSSIGPRVVAS